MNLSPLSSPFVNQSQIQRDGLVWYAPFDEPFSLHGLVPSGDTESRMDCAISAYCRVPESVAAATSESVATLNRHSAGGRIRFCTDSPYIAVRAKPLNPVGMDHMPLTGVSGCDVYSGVDFVGTIRPKDEKGDPYEKLLELGAGEKQITINLPLYNGLSSIAVGLAEGSRVSTPAPYFNEKPVVFYGSSITQGGCASRPGTCYQAYLSRWLNMDYRNLGFSGSAKAEDAMIEYIRSLDMAAFVMDYDHNAPDADHLAKTHEKLFRAVRSAHPELPVLILSKPDVDLSDPSDTAQRLAVIRRTFQNALDAGDKLVAFIDGVSLLSGPDRRECTVDGTHPTDLGFYRMACAIRPVLADLLINS